MTDYISVNIASHLPLMAQSNPTTMAVICPDGSDRYGRVRYVHYTLKQLDEQCDRIAYGLESLGIRKGTRIVLMVTPGLDFFALTFAIFKIGAIPVMIDPGIGLHNLGKCLEEAEPEVFIGIPKAQLARKIFGWGKKTINLSITVGRKIPLAGLTLDDVIKKVEHGKTYEIAQTSSDDKAAILFTSGNTGISKGAVYTHGIFDAQVKSLKEVYRIQPGEIDLATFPLFALFGPALGMTAIIPDMDAGKPVKADMKKIFQAIEDFGPTNMFASPALINKIGKYGEKHNKKIPSLKRVISAGAPARPDDLERFQKMLNSGVQIFTPYGATEALPVCNIGSGEILTQTRLLTDKGRGACVGLPVPGIEVEIIKISDEPILKWSETLKEPEGRVGEIAVKGPVVTTEYFNRPDSTTLAKIPTIDGVEIYHRMGDVGYMDEWGRVWFCGRKSHRVVTKKETYYTIQCEGVFNTHPKVFRTALVGVRKDGEVIPVLCVELEQGIKKVEWTKIKEELLKIGEAHPHTEKITTLLYHPSSFPVDIRHNAKIHREKLKIWAGVQLK
jgi:olefin beta-lactone synthetase